MNVNKSYKNGGIRELLKKKSGRSVEPRGGESVPKHDVHVLWDHDQRLLAFLLHKRIKNIATIYIFNRGTRFEHAMTFLAHATKLRLRGGPVHSTRV